MNERDKVAYRQQHGIPEEVEVYPSLLGVFCDECEITIEGNFIVHSAMTKMERLGVVRDYAVKTFGWLREDGEDLCANCRDDADPKILHAPWTEDEVRLLNAHQANVRVHPFTCGREHTTHQILKAATEGWLCPAPGCQYTQRWALRSMITEIYLKAATVYRTPREIHGKGEDR